MSFKDKIRTEVTAEEEEKLNLARDICQNSLRGLCEGFLGYKDWDIIHDDVEVFLRKPARKKALIMPRGHLKSTFVTIAYSIQQILKNPNIRILIGNQVWDMSRKFLNEIKEQLERSQLKYLFGDFVSAKWNADEIIVKQRTKAFKEPTILTTGIESETTGGHFDTIILDDLTGLQNSQTPEQREKTKRYKRSMINLLEPGGLLIEIGCLVAGTRVLRADGTWKKIEEFLVGEKVLSHDSIETVEAMIPQGKAPVFKLKTRNFTIETTANHPFLTKNSFLKLEDLKVGDKVIVLSSYDVGGNDVSHEDAFAVGFMLGDGWITHHPNNKGSMRYVTCFAKGIDESLNNRVLGYFKSKFDVEPKLTDFGYYRTEVADVGRFFESMGVTGKAKTKRFPAWIYQKKTGIKKSFLDGFIEADGTKMKTKAEQYAVEIANDEMLNDFRYLALTSGIKPSNVYTRTRTIKAPNSPIPVISTTYHASVGTKTRSDRWRETEVISIEPCGEKEVYDLTVSNTHNFVANGFVVHNTRWHMDDTFSVIFEKELMYYDTMTRQIIENGRLIFPRHFAKKFDPIRKDWKTVDDSTCMDYVEHLKRSMPLDEFSAQYLNQPFSSEDQLFKPEMFKYWNQKPDNLYTGIAVDLAISEQRSADYTAIVVCGMDKDWKLYILDYLKGRWKPMDVVKNVFDMQSKWKPYVVGMEVNGFQRTLKLACEEEMRQRKHYFWIDEIKTGPERTKETRIKSLEPFYRNGSVFHAAWMKGKEMEIELQTFPKGRNDDVIDAMSMVLPLLSPGVSGPPRQMQEYSWEWWLEKSKELNRSKGYYTHGI